MRPPKGVLLVDDCEERRNIRRLVLRCHGYRVIDSAASELPLNAVGTLRRMLRAIDVAVIEGDPVTVKTLAARFDRAAPAMKVLAVGAPVSEPFVDVWLARREARVESPGLLLERVAILAIRKRGPKRADSRNAALDRRHGAVAAAVNAEGLA